MVTPGQRQQRALAGTVTAGKAPALAAPYSPVEMINDCVVAIPDRYIIERQNGFAGMVFRYYRIVRPLGIGFSYSGLGLKTPAFQCVSMGISGEVFLLRHQNHKSHAVVNGFCDDRCNH